MAQISDSDLPSQQPWHTFQGSAFNLLKREHRDCDILENVAILGDTSIIVSSDGDLVESAMDELDTPPLSLCLSAK